MAAHFDSKFAMELANVVNVHEVKLVAELEAADEEYTAKFAMHSLYFNACWKRRSPKS